MGQAALSAEPAGEPAGEPADQAVAAPRKKYQVLGHIHVGGENFAPARDKVVSVELTDYEAEGLLAVAAIGPMPEEPASN